MTMNLYLVSRESADWEEDKAAVVAAQSPAVAREVMERRGRCADPSVWQCATTSVSLVGVTEWKQPGVVLVSNRGA